jgi:hypothetical protein
VWWSGLFDIHIIAFIILKIAEHSQQHCTWLIFLIFMIIDNMNCHCHGKLTPYTIYFKSYT